MENITISESGDYYYIMSGDSDADCWPQYKEAKNPDEEIIIRLCKKVLAINAAQEQQQQTIKELAEALSDASDVIRIGETFTVPEHFKKLWKALAAQHLKDK